MEIHGANTYLLQQFFSPHSNRRTDSWGGDVQNRMAFPLAVVNEVKTAVAKYAKAPFIVGYRISPEEIENPGITIEDTLLLVEALAKKNLDYLHVSTMDFWAASMRNPTDTKPRALMIHEKVGHLVPIIGVGGVKNPDEAISVLEAGIPLVAMGRTLLMEPDWAGKAKENPESLRSALNLKQQQELVIPDILWNALTSRPGWITVTE